MQTDWLASLILYEETPLSSEDESDPFTNLNCHSLIDFCSTKINVIKALYERTIIRSKKIQITFSTFSSTANNYFNVYS